MEKKSLKQVDPKVLKSAEMKIQKAKVQMIGYFPFFGILMLKLETTEDMTIETLATDAKKLYYNPEYVNSLPDSQVNWALVHEVMHCALQHIWRQGTKIHKVWNMACDYAIHDTMHQYISSSDEKYRRLLQMNPHWLYDKNFKDKSADEIYDILIKEYEKQKNGKSGANGNGNGGIQNGERNGQYTFDDHSKWGKKVNGKQQSDSENKIEKNEWQGNLIAAAQIAKNQKNVGKMPAGLERVLGNLTKPQKDWRMLLHEFCQEEISDFGFCPPDRRFGDMDFFMPDFSETIEVIKHLIFWIDTSGSVGDDELKVIYGEMSGAVEQFNNKLSGWVGFFDAKAYEPKPFENVEDILKIRPVGGGGTDFTKPFKYMDKHMKDKEIAGVIFITDGYDTWPDINITNDIPVLWLITNENRIPPWGKHATIKIGQED